MLLKLLTWTPSPCDTWMGGTLPPTAPALIPYTNFSSNKPMTNLYYVACPALGESEEMTDLDRAMDICYSMHEESDSYAFIRDAFGNIVGEYGDARETVSRHV